MTENVRQSVKIGAREVDVAVQPLIAGDGSMKFFQDANHVLTRSKNYARVLEDASMVGFESTAVHAGFVAGLKAASEILNINYEFLIEA